MASNAESLPSGVAVALTTDKGVKIVREANDTKAHPEHFFLGRSIWCLCLGLLVAWFLRVGTSSAKDISDAGVPRWYVRPRSQ